MEQYLKDNNFKRQEDLLTELALGNLLSTVVAAKLAPEVSNSLATDEQTEALSDLQRPARSGRLRNRYKVIWAQCRHGGNQENLKQLFQLFDLL